MKYNIKILMVLLLGEREKREGEGVNGREIRATYPRVAMQYTGLGFCFTSRRKKDQDVIGDRTRVP